MTSLERLIAIACFLVVVTACSSAPSEEWVNPNFDDFVGRTYSDAVLKGQPVDRSRLRVRETDLHEELATRRSDGCVLVFGVRRVDDVIDYWRVDSGPNTCKVSTRTRHTNQ